MVESTRTTQINSRSEMLVATLGLRTDSTRFQTFLQFRSGGLSRSSVSVSERWMDAATGSDESDGGSAKQHANICQITCN